MSGGLLEAFRVKFCAVVATHHKTGTAWMQSVFRRIARVLDVGFVEIDRRDGLESGSLIVPSILFNTHSAFSGCQWILDHPQCRLFHLIRDPRDVIVSAMHYHRAAAEPWLHEPRADFGGKTYQMFANGLPDDQSRYVFEMQHGAGNAIKAMRRWQYDRENTFECRYEDLISDTNSEKFAGVLRHLGFEDDEMTRCRRIFVRNSLFGSRKKKGHSLHVRSGRARQWETTFNAELASAFVDLFGDVLIELGYEPDNSWVATLPSRGEQERAAGPPT
ncbi:MAG: sulfotransferase domain-containing protein [Rhizomicrobium sp.]|jgi:hypothetical protein